ncbi:NFkB protein [Anopheles sinensis]|uniref:NFkB protein n=1 Tax=Anopheles sinensis TaxID=74873 RepID=A0A084W1K5_ANOSI|nr:NFkB protein [Anopheles sinensis]
MEDLGSSDQKLVSPENMNEIVEEVAPPDSGDMLTENRENENSRNLMDTIIDMKCCGGVECRDCSCGKFLWRVHCGHRDHLLSVLDS